MTESKPSDAKAVLKLAETAIVNNNSKELSSLFTLMPLEQLEADETNEFFSQYMDLCTAYDRSECMKVVFESWGRVYPESEDIPIFTKLFLIPMVNVNTISFIARTYPDYSYLEVMDDIVRYDSVPYIPIACDRVVKVFGEQPYETYKMLLELSGETNPGVSNYLAGKIRKISPFAPKPKWVSDFREGEYKTLPFQSEVKIPEKIPGAFELPPIDEIVRQLAEGIEHSGITVDDKQTAVRLIRAKVSIATTAERIELLKPIIDLSHKIEQQSDDGIFRVLGPSNPLIGGSSKEMNYGGCRMFICEVFDFNQDTGYVEDWFEGYCYKCDLRIRTRWHAIRMPRPSGGWIGCYCSWKCVRDAVYSSGVNPEGKNDMITDLLIDDFETQINIIGIQDRIPDSKAQIAKVSEAITSTIIPPTPIANTKENNNTLPFPVSKTDIEVDSVLDSFTISQTPTDKYVESVDSVTGNSVSEDNVNVLPPILVPLPTEIPLEQSFPMSPPSVRRSVGFSPRSPSRSPGDIFITDNIISKSIPMISPPVFSILPNPTPGIVKVSPISDTK